MFELQFTTVFLLTTGGLLMRQGMMQAMGIREVYLVPHSSNT